MSYNIGSTNTPVFDAYMDAGDIVSLYTDHEGDLCEGNFIDKHYKQAVKALADGSDRRIKLKNLWWYGEGSGSTYKFFLKTIAPKIMGKVEAIFTWEGGDSFSGIIIEDGKVVEGKVEQRVVPE